jgi:HK97 family phage portal protein
MAFFDIFKSKNKDSKESNTLFGQTALGNNILYQGNSKNQYVNTQVLYVTTGSSTDAGRPVDVSTMSRNSTIMSCVATKARALAQLPISIKSKGDDGQFIDAIKDASVGPRDKAKAKSVLNLLNSPNNFQSKYEFWYQFIMWLELSGETFTLLWRKDQEQPSQTPLEMYILDSTLVANQLTPTRYPSYRISTPMYGFNKDEPLAYYQVMHVMEMPWQGSAGFNKGLLATELVGLDQDIDLYANYIMQNGAKPSGLFSTTLTIPDAKYKEIASRIKETWNQMIGSTQSDPSKAGQGMLLDNGMTYTPLKMLSLQDADAYNLKVQTMKRICGVFGVPPAMIGIADQKYNNTQTMLDEFYKNTMNPLIQSVQEKLKMSLFQGFPNLFVEFESRDFLKGAPLDQMNYAVQGVNGGILTPNEAREYMGFARVDGGDEIKEPQKAPDIKGTSPQDTGGGGGNQTRKMNIGK